MRRASRDGHGARRADRRQLPVLDDEGARLDDGELSPMIRRAPSKTVARDERVCASSHGDRHHGQERNEERARLQAESRHGHPQCSTAHRNRWLRDCTPDGHVCPQSCVMGCAGAQRAVVRGCRTAFNERQGTPDAPEVVRCDGGYQQRRVPHSEFWCLPRLPRHRRRFLYDHVHINVPDTAAAANWYEKHFGGTRITEAPDRLRYGSTRVMFLKLANAQPSAGSAIDHIGFSVKDIDATFRDFAAEGVKVVTPVRDLPGIFKIGFIEDPWGTRIEVVQDPELLGLHHIHMRGPDTEAVFTWLLAKFGGERTKLKGQLDAVRYRAAGFSDMWILVQRGEATPSEARDRSHRLAFDRSDCRHHQWTARQECAGDHRAASCRCRMVRRSTSRAGRTGGRQDRNRGTARTQAWE